MSLITIDSPLVYISGPMTGRPALNYPAFHEAAKQVEARGWVAVNPACKSTPSGLPWATYLRKDIAMLIKCTAILMLPDWQHSKGASLELHIARELEFGIYHLKKNGDILPGDGREA